MAGSLAPVSVPLVGGAPLVDATFVARPNRFVVAAELADGTPVQAHLADRGRLTWLTPGLPLLLGAKPQAGRKTPYQVAAVFHAGRWVSVDTHLPNRLIEQALRLQALPPWAAYPLIQREVKHGASRFDFRVAHDGRECYIEVKSVGEVREALGLFPDAPTTRGVRHLAELRALHQAGTRTALVFVVQGAGAQAVQVNQAIDPAFAEALSQTLQAGVEVYAYGCRIERSGITLERPLPVVDVVRGIWHNGPDQEKHHA